MRRYRIALAAGLLAAASLFCPGRGVLAQGKGHGNQGEQGKQHVPPGQAKKRVVTAGGEVIGDGDDLIFDETSGAITALQLAPQGGFLGIGATTPTVPIEEVVEFGPDVITVQDTAVTRVRPTE